MLSGRASGGIDLEPEGEETAPAWDPFGGKSSSEALTLAGSGSGGSDLEPEGEETAPAWDPSGAGGCNYYIGEEFKDAAVQAGPLEPSADVAEPVAQGCGCGSGGGGGGGGGGIASVAVAVD